MNKTFWVWSISRFAPEAVGRDCRQQPVSMLARDEKEHYKEHRNR